MKLTKIQKIEVEKPIMGVSELLKHLHTLHAKVSDVMEGASEITGLIEDCHDHVTDEQYDFLYENFDHLSYIEDGLRLASVQGDLWEAIEKLEKATKPDGPSEYLLSKASGSKAGHPILVTEKK